jgi:hypothetical protein
MSASAAMIDVPAPAAARHGGSANSFGELRARAKELLAANINPRTGLATDYLNHFNEAVMMLEMIPDLPECAEDFLAWTPLSYAQHFRASNFKAKELAIEAYDAADPAAREQFDTICDNMTMILTAVGEALRQVNQDHSRARLAEEAIGWVKPLVMQAAGIINGHEADEAEVDHIMTE